MLGGISDALTAAGGLEGPPRGLLCVWSGALSCESRGIGLAPYFTGVCVCSIRCPRHPSHGVVHQALGRGVCQEQDFPLCRRSQHPCWGSPRLSELHRWGAILYLRGSARRPSFSHLGSKAQVGWFGVHRWGLAPGIRGAAVPADMDEPMPLGGIRITGCCYTACRRGAESRKVVAAQQVCSPEKSFQDVPLCGTVGGEPPWPGGRLGGRCAVRVPGIGERHRGG